MNVIFQAPSPNDLAVMLEKFRETRKRVYLEATHGDGEDATAHSNNQKLLRDKITELSNNSKLDNYGVAPQIRRDGNFSGDPEGRLWHLIWSRNRYAGIRGKIASQEIDGIRHVFDLYQRFKSSDWDLVVKTEARRPVIERAGSQVIDFLKRQGDFEGRQTIGNLRKLRTIISVARLFNEFIEAKTPQTPAYHFVTGGAREDLVQEIHKHLVENIGYRRDLTALHLMMDMGFEVIKPDIIVTRLFFQWGWLHRVIPNLPSDLQIQDLQGDGNYKSRFIYTKPKMYWPVIELARLIVARMDRQQLADDIGWVSDNLLREFDIFVVKFGQRPEPAFGVVRQLANWQGLSDPDLDPDE
jgi:hypothetical protein